MNELKDLFSLDRVSKGGAVFDYKKLLWYNEHYLRKKSADELFPRVEEIAHEYDIEPDEEYMKQIITLMKDRVSKVDRKSTRLNSSHVSISYAVFCLKKKKEETRRK